MNCNKCGAELQEQEKFCPHCGETTSEQIAPEMNNRVMDTNSQSTDYSGNVSAADDRPQQKRQSFTLALAGLVVAVIMLIIMFAANYVIVAYITFIAPVASFVAIPRDKKNGHNKFLTTILINIATLVIAAILLVVYIKFT